MNDMKELFNKENKELTNVVWFSFFKDSNIVMENPNYDWVEDKDIIERKNLGIFFWNRGGKNCARYVIKGKENATINDIINYAQDVAFDYVEAVHFLDCVACLGEDKVKELIKDLKGAKTTTNKTPSKSFELNKEGMKTKWILKVK